MKFRAPTSAARALALGTLLGGVPLRVVADDLVLPLAVPFAQGGYAIEIDGVDLTEFTRIEDGQIVVSTAAPLGPGRHQAVVYVVSGDMVSRYASYDFTTGAAPVSSEMSLTAKATHEAGAKAVNGEGEAFATSTGEVAVETLDQSVVASLTYVASSRDEDQVAGRPFDIAAYKIELKQSGALLDVGAVIGHQTLSWDGALVADLTRRGLSVDASTPGGRFEAALFGLKATEAFGAENILGLAQDDDRMFGGRIAFRPFFGNDLRLSLQGYDGEGVSPLGSQAGIGWGKSLSLDGTLFDSRLIYAASYGQTTWDDDGAGVLPEDQGEALLLSLDYDVLNGDTGKLLTLGLDYERVDLYYFSLANPGLPLGGETWRLSADYSAERLALNGSLETTLTNIGGDPLDVTDRVSLVTLDGTYDLFDAGALSDASLMFGLTYDDLRRVETPLGLAPLENWHTLTAYAGIAKTTEFGTWDVTYTFTDTEDESAFDEDIISHDLTGHLDRDFGERLSLTTSASLTYYQTASIGAYWRTEARAGVGYDLDPDVWYLNVDLGFTNTGEFGVEDGGFLAAELTRQINPATDLVFNAGYYEGPYAQESGQDHETILGLRLRVTSDFTR